MIALNQIIDVKMFWLLTKIWFVFASMFVLGAVQVSWKIRNIWHEEHPFLDK